MLSQVGQPCQAVLMSGFALPSKLQIGGNDKNPKPVTQSKLVFDDFMIQLALY